MTQVLNTNPRKTVEVYTTETDHGLYDHRQFFIAVTTDGETEVIRTTAKVYRTDIDQVGVCSIMYALLACACKMVCDGKRPRVPKDKHGKTKLPFAVVVPSGGTNADMLTIPIGNCESRP